MASSETATASIPILALKRLDKWFGATHALKAVDLSFNAGEIHAIVGENGAGKSTLIKLLTGVHPRSSGQIIWRGLPVGLSDPREALALGINAVHQEVVLCQHLTVAANIFLGDEASNFGLLDDRSMVREGQALLDNLGFHLPASARLSSLTIGQQQLVATARAERRGVKFLIFDEPTAYLSRQEASALFALIGRLRAAGVTIVYITHRLEEVFELADRVSVLRDGALVATRTPRETNESELISLMINRAIDQIYVKEPVAAGAVILSTEHLSGLGFNDVSITIRKGEIVGLYGLIGSGRSEFAQALFGRRSASSGRILWQGEAVSIQSERTAMALGIALTPESRRDQGLCLNLGVGFNINLPILDRLQIGPLLDPGREAAHAGTQIGNLRIKANAVNAPVASLSGGNQQKVVIGKWLNHGAKLFIFDEPTTGVDVGTKAEIYRLFADLLRGGAGILMISSYLPEIYALADSLIVFRAGKVVARHHAKEVPEETILAEAIGA